VKFKSLIATVYNSRRCQ